MKGFTGYRWWEQTNPAYREACFRQAVRETLQDKISYDFFIKHTSNKS